jgi:hypothetical protein
MPNKAYGRTPPTFQRLKPTNHDAVTLSPLLHRRRQRNVLGRTGHRRREGR